MRYSESSGRKRESILHKDIKDLELAKTVRKISSIRVTEWELSDLLPAINRISQKEVDVVEIFKRTANYRVTDWEIKELLHLRDKSHYDRKQRQSPTGQDVQAFIVDMSRFLGFMTSGLVEMPDQAKIKAAELEPGVLRFKLLLEKRDAAALIGHGGHSAAAIRRLMKDAGHRRGLHVLLQILSHEEAAAVQAE